MIGDQDYRIPGVLLPGVQLIEDGGVGGYLVIPHPEPTQIHNSSILPILRRKHKPHGSVPTDKHKTAIANVGKTILCHIAAIAQHPLRLVVQLHIGNLGDI